MISKTYYLAICLILTVCCSKDDFDMHDPDVDQFVSIVKEGNYFEELGFELPDFTMKHIERLLYYSKDTSTIEEFPINPISSRYSTPKILNECLLWTIEGIRFANKYPSLEPCLIDTSEFIEDPGNPRLTGRELIGVANIYISWYEDYKAHPTEALRTKNLLENTSYIW
jgi:hypothetical protein